MFQTQVNHLYTCRYTHMYMHTLMRTHMHANTDMHTHTHTTGSGRVWSCCNHYHNESNYSNHPIIRTPPLFQEMWLINVFQAFEHPRLKLLFQYLNTYTLRSSNRGCQMCGARVTKRLLAYYRHFRTFTRLLLSLWRSNRGSQMSFNNFCGAWTGVRENLLAFYRPSYQRVGRLSM